MAGRSDIVRLRCAAVSTACSPSRAPPNSPLENFTTEALAAAVERDPGPLLRALPRDVADVGALLEARVGRVDTQVRVPGGIVDLVVDLWIEVNAYAGLSGDQLHAYRAAAKRAAVCLARPFWRGTR